MQVSHQRQFSWINTLYLVGSPILLMIAVPLDYYFRGGPSGSIWIFALFYYMLTGLSITGGYHRLYSHRAYDTHPVIRFMLLMFGAGALQNSALKWSVDHRRHHRYVDTENDPYNINEGFFWAHMGWVFYDDPALKESEIPADLGKDRWVRFQHNYYLPIALFMCFGVPTLFGWFVGDALSGLLYGGLARVVFSSHATFLINSAAHYFGQQTYSATVSARDNWVLALISYGEGYHSFHHQFQFDYRNGIRWFHWDPTKWIVATLERIGLASNVRRTSDHAIWLAKMNTAEALLKEKGVDTSPLNRWAKMIHEQQEKIRVLREEYLALKRARWEHSKESFENLKQNLKQNIREAQTQFRYAYRTWKREAKAF